MTSRDAHLELPPLAGDVRFNEVRFSYDPEKPVLHGISFHAEPGSVTALVGSSGSGKSTIISLVCAFHEPDSGSILVDGVDLSTVNLDSYRSQLGVVLQESFLFDGSIRDNVMFSRPDATEKQLLHACAVARVDEFAERFPEGYETIVGERGVKLSGGQRQRLSIARAILAEPRILILDEATSSLDSESEAMIQHGLSFLMQGRTTFVIAHRLSTIRRADQILVVEAGRIVEHGTHETLFALGGRYYDLYTGSMDWTRTASWPRARATPSWNRLRNWPGTPSPSRCGRRSRKSLSCSGIRSLPRAKIVIPKDLSLNSSKQMAYRTMHGLVSGPIAGAGALTHKRCRHKKATTPVVAHCEGISYF